MLARITRREQEFPACLFDLNPLRIAERLAPAQRIFKSVYDASFAACIPGAISIFFPERARANVTSIPSRFPVCPFNTPVDEP
jgi:hypothetical protein